ncbi:MAG: flavin reductase family protein [Chloroflexota bacterium]
MNIDFDNLDRKQAHELFTCLISPRPIAWISTVAEDGTYNLAPFSFFNGISSRPPILLVSIGRRKGQKKDTIRNIEYSGDFVVNAVDESLAEKMNQTSADYPPNISEFKETGLTPLPGDKVKSPRLAESPVSMECVLLQVLQMGRIADNYSVVLGEVVRVHVRDTVIRNGEIDMSQLRLVARMGRDLYCRSRDIFEMKRPTYP